MSFQDMELEKGRYRAKINGRRGSKTEEEEEEEEAVDEDRVGRGEP